MRDQLTLFCFHERINDEVMAFFMIGITVKKFIASRSHYPASQTVTARHTEVVIEQNMTAAAPYLIHKHRWSPATGH